MYNKLNEVLSKQLNVYPCDFLEPYLHEKNTTFIPWNKGMKNPYSKETCEMISKSNKGKKKRLGVKLTETTKEKIRKKALERDYSYLKRKVKTPLGVFDSLSEAAEVHEKSNAWITKKMKSDPGQFFIL